VLAHLGADGPFELLGDFLGPLALVFEELKAHLVDGTDLLDGEDAFHRPQDLLVDLDVAARAGLADDDPGAAGAGLVDRGAGLDPAPPGLVAGGDADGGLGLHRDDADGLAPKVLVILLLHRGEVGVHIQEEIPHRHSALLRGGVYT